MKRRLADPEDQSAMNKPAHHLATDRADGWLAFRRGPKDPRLRIMCFPFAGGSALAYRDWMEDLPSDVELCPLQLPGRGQRFREHPWTDLAALAEAAILALGPLVDGRHVLFGHSMGAALAYEVARRAEAKGWPAARLVAVSARVPAHWPTLRPMHDLPDSEFVSHLRELGGMAEKILTSPEMMALVLPLARADFRANDTYRSEGTPIRAPISAFGGLSDETVDPAALETWEELTRGRFRLHLFEGGHFYLNRARAEVVAAILHDAS